MPLAEMAPFRILQAQVGRAQCDRRLDEVQQDLFIIFGLLCRGVSDPTSLYWSLFAKLKPSELKEPWCLAAAGNLGQYIGTASVDSASLERQKGSLSRVCDGHFTG